MKSAPPTVIIATHAHPYPGVLHTPPLHAYALTCHHQEQTQWNSIRKRAPLLHPIPTKKSEICERENTHTCTIVCRESPKAFKFYFYLQSFSVRYIHSRFGKVLHYYYKLQYDEDEEELSELGFCNLFVPPDVRPGKKLLFDSGKSRRLLVNLLRNFEFWLEASMIITFSILFL
ncbi:hypothetical protein L2E82_07398 [Cichorium intybus]|uniref:Uncharacterized protein n=1 Tax=Cichorium intybus TaxID=13427 RepID=A0ACB9G579_CICIN|nr:hypothetical protein L2E82_07398 [Cichorium intybus]